VGRDFSSRSLAPQSVTVSIHAPAWGATKSIDYLKKSVRVSIHAPAWGATQSASESCQAWAVSIHAPAWGATDSPVVADRAIRVSIHAPAWGATQIRALAAELKPFQSTRPRGARPMFDEACGKNDQVSIHAPAWGATSGMGACRGARAGFNPRARVGRDPELIAHLPARHGFNPRARVGRDQVAHQIYFQLWMFQSTRPRGARLYIVSIVYCYICFNPRARVGRDSSPEWRGAGRRCFNPRARVGRDFSSRSLAPQSVTVSIHAPAWGATLYMRGSSRTMLVSIHAPAWGATTAIR